MSEKRVTILLRDTTKKELEKTRAKLMLKNNVVIKSLDETIQLMIKLLKKHGDIDD
jgi:hypothetical protein